MDLEELREYCITNHRDMWHWLADNPDKEKAGWPGWKYHDDDDFDKEGSNYCFLCGYVSTDPDKSCFDCPLEWGVSDMCWNGDDDSYYEMYSENCLTLSDRAYYARIIANLPEKKR